MRLVMQNNWYKTKKQKDYNQFPLHHITNNNSHLKIITIIFYLIFQTHLFIINSNQLDRFLDNQSKKRKEPQFSVRLILLMQVEHFSLTNFQEVITSLHITFKCSKAQSIILIAP